MCPLFRFVSMRTDVNRGCLSGFMADVALVKRGEALWLSRQTKTCLVSAARHPIFICNHLRTVACQKSSSTPYTAKECLPRQDHSADIINLANSNMRLNEQLIFSIPPLCLDNCLHPVRHRSR